MIPHNRSLRGLAAFAILFLAGCASDGLLADRELPFANRDVPCTSEDCTGPQFVQFERGQPHPFVDGAGWVLGIPGRLLLWNRDVQSHNISIETEQQLRQYVAANGLDDVKVRLNQYDPGGEWQRLAQNERVAPGWKYTVGALGTLGYTLFPGRLFGIDHYNPFTHTVNVYSDVPALGMKEIAYAGDVIDRDLPGTYAFSQLIPGVHLVHETITTRDVLDYVHDSGDLAMQEEAVHVLYPYYGGSAGGGLGVYIPAGGLLPLGGLLAGHVSGRMETRRREPALLSEDQTTPTERPTLTPPEKLFAMDARPILSEPTSEEEPAPGKVVTASHEEPAEAESE